MERHFFLNGKPLLKPPASVAEVLDDRLRSSNLEFGDVVKLNERPHLFVLELDGLKSAYINKDPLFQALLQQIMDWNEKITLYNSGQINLQTPHVTDRLFRELKNQLHEIVNCKNRQQQQIQLARVREWYASQLNKTQQNLLSQSLQAKKDDVTLPLALQLSRFQDHDYPEHMYQSSVKDYYDKYRSVHRELDPPQDRVKTYQRKTLLSDVSTRPGTVPQHMGLSQISRPQTSQTTYKMIEQLDKLSRPRTNQQQLSQSKVQPSFLYDTSFPVFETFEEQKTTRRNIFRQDSPLKAEKPVQEEDEGALNEEEEAESPDGPAQSQKRMSQSSVGSPMKKGGKKTRADKYISIAPDQKTYKNDAQTEAAYKPYNQDRVGELQSNFQSHNPCESVEDQEALARLNQIYFTNRQKEVKEQREDAEMIQQLKEWANNKGRIEEMIVHKGYLSTLGSQFANVGIKMDELFDPKNLDYDDEQAYNVYLKQACSKSNHSRMVQSSGPQIPVIENTILPTQVEEEIEDFQSKQAFLEQRISKAKLENLKQTRGKWLPGGMHPTPSMDYIHTRKSMSTSSFKNGALGMNRPFSGVFQGYSIKKEADKQVSEVNAIKNRLASAQQFVPITVLQKSLVIPQGHKDPTKVLLPQPSMLLANIPVAAKRGARKKKKAKK